MGVSSRLLKQLQKSKDSGLKPYLESIHAHLECLLEEQKLTNTLLTKMTKGDQRTVDVDPNESDDEELNTATEVIMDDDVEG